MSSIRSSRAGLTQAQINDIAIQVAQARDWSNFAENSTHYFFGGEIGGSWIINRYEKGTIVKGRANVDNNATETTLSSAWVNREALNYVQVSV